MRLWIEWTDIKDAPSKYKLYMQMTDWRLPERQVNWEKECFQQSVSFLFLSFHAARERWKTKPWKFSPFSSLVGAQHGLFVLARFCIRRTEANNLFWSWLYWSSRGGLDLVTESCWHALGFLQWLLGMCELPLRIRKYDRCACVIRSERDSTTIQFTTQARVQQNSLFS